MGPLIRFLGVIFALSVILYVPSAYGAPFAYITNAGDNTVSVIDTATNTVTATVLGLGPNPQGVAVHPAGTSVYVINIGRSVPETTVSVIDTAINTASTILVGRYFRGVAVDPTGAVAYVTTLDAQNTVQIIDTVTNTVIGGISAGTGPLGPYGVAVHPQGTFLYAADINGNKVSVINTATAVATTVDLSPNLTPVSVAVEPKGTFVYVTNNDSNTVSVIATSTNNVVATIPVGAGPIGVAVHPTKPFVYVTNSGHGTTRDVGSVNSNTVAVINTTTYAVSYVPVGVEPRGVSVHPNGMSVYVANESDDTVSVIDTNTNMVISTIMVGDRPVAFGQFIANPSPIVAVAGLDQSVIEGAVVSLDGTASTGQHLTFKWEQLPGGPAVTLSNSASAIPTFTAPLLLGGFGSQVLTFKLTVTSGGQSSAAVVNVTVINVNHAPDAHVGADQVVNEPQKSAKANVLGHASY